MKNIARILASVALVASCIPAGAKSRTLARFIDKVSSSLVTFNYSFTMQTPKSQSRMTGSGMVKVQGSAFYMEGNGLEVWCDGSTCWTIDRLSEEALVESVGSSYESYATNPALMVTSVDEAFTEISSGTSKFQGKVVDVSILSPVRKGNHSMDIAMLKLFFKDGTSVLVGAEVRLNDGSVSEFAITDLEFSPKEETEEPFRFDEKALEESYVVTDLR